MQKKHTPKTKATQTKSRKHPDQLATLLKETGVKVTGADRATARRLDTLYHDKQTPKIIKHTIFQIFWDLHMHYSIKLPKNFDDSWLPFWAAFGAVNRRQGHMPTHIDYTWSPSPEEEAELDEQDKKEADTRAIFELFHNQNLPPVIAEELRGTIDSILDAAHPTSSFEVFRVAWPLALERYESETEESGDTDLQAKLKRELNADASALARLLNSETFPLEIQELLGERVLSLGSELSEEPEVIKAQYPLAVMRQMEERAGRETTDGDERADK